jgi:HSP20 family protein
MAITRWDPLRDLLSVEEEFERALGRSGNRQAWAPTMDVRETDDHFEVSVDLPGLEPGDVSVTFEDGVLTISGKREISTERSDETYHRIERSYGSFARSLRLPRTADGEKIEASFDKGVLTVTVPKAEIAKPKTIEVKTK